MATITFTKDAVDMFKGEGRTVVERYKAGTIHVLPENVAARFTKRGQARPATAAELAAYRAEAAAKLARARAWLAA